MNTIIRKLAKLYAKWTLAKAMHKPGPLRSRVVAEFREYSK